MADDQVDPDTLRKLLASQPPEPTNPTSPTDPSASAPRVKTAQENGQLSPQSTGNISPPPTFSMPPTPKLYDAPYPGQFGLAPQQQEPSPFEVFKNPMVVLAGLSSLFTRQPLMGAMNFATGAMNGYRQGNNEIFQQNKTKFDEAIKATIEQNKTELDKYSVAWDRKKGEAFAKSIPQLWTEAVKNNDQVMMAALQSNNPDIVWKLLESRQTSQLHLENAYQEAKIREQVREEAQPSITPTGLQTMADQYLAGDKSVLQNLGRGNQGSANISAFRNLLSQTMKEKGISGADQATKMAEYSGLVAGERTLGTYGAKIGQAGKAVDYFADQALEASEAFPRGSVVPYNKAIQAYQAGTSNPRLYDLGFALFSLVNAYARAINPQGVPRIQDKEHANQYISTVTSDEALRAVIARLKKEVVAEQKATKDEQQDLRGGGSSVIHYDSQGNRVQ